MGLAPWGAVGGGQFKTEEQWKAQEEGRVNRSTEADRKVSEVLEKIAKRKDTIITNIALAYIMHKAPYVFPIVGIRKIEHLQGNIDALSIELSKEDVDEIEGAVPFDLGFPQSLLWGTSVPSSYQPWLLNLGGHFDYVDLPKVSFRYFRSLTNCVTNDISLSNRHPKQSRTRCGSTAAVASTVEKVLVYFFGICKESL